MMFGAQPDIKKRPKTRRKLNDAAPADRSEILTRACDGWTVSRKADGSVNDPNIICPKPLSVSGTAQAYSRLI